MHIHSLVNSSARVFALLVLACSAQGAFAINKCKGKDGAVLYQDAPCGNATASGEQVKTWDNTPGTYHTGPEGREVKANDKIVGPPQAAVLLKLYRRWIDAEKLATSASPAALMGPVAVMQAIQRDAESVDVAACLAESKAALGAITAKSTDVLLQVMQKPGATAADYAWKDRGKLVIAFEQSVTSAKCGSPAT